MKILIIYYHLNSSLLINCIFNTNKIIVSILIKYKYLNSEIFMKYR